MAKQYGKTIPFPKKKPKKKPQQKLQQKSQQHVKNLKKVTAKAMAKEKKPKLKVVSTPWYKKLFQTTPVDYTIVFLVMFLTIFGLVMVYSTSSYKSSLNYDGDTTHWLRRQLGYAIVGVILMFCVSFINYRCLKNRRLQMIIYGGIAVVLVSIMILAQARKGAKRWASVGGVNFQPSEIAKIVLILFLAYIISTSLEHMKDNKGVLKVFGMALPIIVLVGVENLSTSIILMAITVVMIFVASPKIIPILGILGVGGIGAIVLSLLRGYRVERIKVWLDLEGNEKGRQTLQGLYAIGSGGIFGKGLGQSMQKMGFVPESHNDMIFSIICEELGLFGAISVLALFFILLWRFMIIAINADDLFGAMIVVGVIAHLGIQVFVNIGVVTNTIPNTGIPLPFISYGGSSLVCLLVEMGLVLSVSRQIRIKK